METNGSSYLTTAWRSGGHRRSAAAITAIAAGSAAVGAVAAWRYTHHPPVHAEEDHSYELRLLSDLADDEAALAVIQRELLAEWGRFGPADMPAMRRMVTDAGHLTYVIGTTVVGAFVPCGVLQTGRAEVGGDPERLIEQYPSFRAITAEGTWAKSPSMTGDTALLLQITAFGERSRGVGSALRQMALDSLPTDVRFALTTTPVPDAQALGSDPDAFPPAVRFHFGGGARPAGSAKGYKSPGRGRGSRNPGRHPERDVVFMRYERLENGEWRGLPHRQAASRDHLPAPLLAALRRLRPAGRLSPARAA